MLQGWRAAGAELVFFSPLADETPDLSCDACWLPGGYPELHAGRLASAGGFMTGLRGFAETRPIHGECGGYMVLGRTLTDAAGAAHPMAGLLGVSTSFAKRKLHLGYRTARLLEDGCLGQAGTELRGHEFHYASIEDTGDDALPWRPSPTPMAAIRTGRRPARACLRQLLPPDRGGMTMAGAPVFVCVSCKQDDTQSPRPGVRAARDAVAAEVSARGLDLQVTPVECLSVCKRPCTIAFAAEGKWTYVIGDLEAGTHVDDIVTGAERYAASTNGIVPWRERPVPVRRGVLARVPPMQLQTGRSALSRHLDGGYRVDDNWHSERM